MNRVQHGTALLPTLLACAALLAAGGAGAQQPGQQIMPNYRGADLRQVIEAVGEVTGRNFLVDPRVTGQVTFLSYAPMSPEAFYEAFLATLQIHGFIAVESEDIVRIVPDATARVHPGIDDELEGDRIVTRAVQLVHVGAAQLVPILRPLIPQYGHLAAHPGSNTLIIVDRGSNVDRLLEIIVRMDQESDEEIEVIRLENASAGEVAAMLSTLEQAAVTEGAPSVLIAADDRTNSVLLTGPAERKLRYRALIAHLDTPAGETGNTHVRYLNYALAEDLASNLQTQFGAAGAAEGGAEADVNIWADAGTNSLIVSAPARIMADIDTVVDRLDIRRAQVQVDAIIVELLERRANELGVNWGVLGAGDGDRPIAGTNFSSPNAPGILQLAGAVAGGTAAGGVGQSALDPQGLLAAVGDIADSGTRWAALLSALASDTATNIVATPTLVTLDNEEATISVGSEVPFVTGQYTSTTGVSGTLNPYSTIQRNPVGTTLTITPQINEGSGVKLTISQETSSLSPAVEGAVDLVTDKREITTSVFVDDGNILVLGGLIDDQSREVERRVPLLGRLPGIGALFRSQSTEVEKTNLMVFIRPTILRDSTQAAFHTNAKYRYIRDLQLRQGERALPLLSDVQRPMLPELEAAATGAPTSATDAGGEADAALAEPGTDAGGEADDGPDAGSGEAGDNGDSRDRPDGPAE